MSRKQIIGLIGSILLFAGVFCPIVSLPFVGGMNYFHNGKGDGVIIILFAVISVVLTSLKKYKGLWFTGICSIAVMIFTFVNFQTKISELEAQTAAEMAGNPFGGLAGAMIQSVQLQWGWAILITGAALIMVAAKIKEDSYEEEGSNIGGKAVFAGIQNAVNKALAYTHAEPAPLIPGGLWYYAENGQPYGPYSGAADLTRLVRSGKLTPDTLVWNGTPGNAEQGWARASMTDLSVLFRA